MPGPAVAVWGDATNCRGSCLRLETMPRPAPAVWRWCHHHDLLQRFGDKCHDPPQLFGADSLIYPRERRQDLTGSCLLSWDGATTSPSSLEVTPTSRCSYLEMMPPLTTAIAVWMKSPDLLSRDIMRFNYVLQTFKCCHTSANEFACKALWVIFCCSKKCSLNKTDLT